MASTAVRTSLLWKLLLNPSASVTSSISMTTKIGFTVAAYSPLTAVAAKPPAAAASASAKYPFIIRLPLLDFVKRDPIDDRSAGACRCKTAPQPVQKPEFKCLENTKYAAGTPSWWSRLPVGAQIEELQHEPHNRCYCSGRNDARGNEPRFREGPRHRRALCGTGLRGCAGALLRRARRG